MGGVLYTLRSGSASFTHYNHRGDVTAKTSATGSLTYQSTYDAFGARSAEVGSTPDREKSNTKPEDLPGYANEGFRYRDLETGVFLTRDPLGFVDGPNLYTYVVQNPWTKFDPEGLNIVKRLKEAGKQVIKHDETGRAVVNGRRVQLPKGVKPGDTYNLPGQMGKKYSGGVKFDKEGFADFSPYSQKDVKIDMTGDNPKDVIAANQAAGFDSTPKDMTWHHNQDGETMQLIPSELNDAVPHTGGAAVARSARDIAIQTGLIVGAIIAPNTVEAAQSGGNVVGGVVKDVGEAVSTPLEVATTAAGAGDAAAGAANNFTDKARGNWTEKQVQQYKSGIPALDEANEEMIRGIRPAWNSGQ